MKTTSWTTVVLCVVLASLFTGCKKKRMEARYFNCTINGEKFESPYSNSLFIHNADPKITLEEMMGDSLRVMFTSDCNPVDNARRSPNYVLMWEAQVPRTFTTGTRYKISTPRDIDSFRRAKRPLSMLYYLETVKEENPDPSFSVSYIEDRRFSGTGFVEFTRIDLNKEQFDGRVEFEFLPATDNPDSTRHLFMEGEWKIME